MTAEAPAPRNPSQYARRGSRWTQVQTIRRVVGVSAVVAGGALLVAFGHGHSSRRADSAASDEAIQLQVTGPSEPPSPSTTSAAVRVTVTVATAGPATPPAVGIVPAAAGGATTTMTTAGGVASVQAAPVAAGAGTTTTAAPTTLAGPTSSAPALEYTPEPVKGDGVCTKTMFQSVMTDFVTSFKPRRRRARRGHAVELAVGRLLHRPLVLGQHRSEQLRPYVRELYDRGVRIDTATLVLSGYDYKAGESFASGWSGYGASKRISMTVACRTMGIALTEWQY